MKIPLFQWMQLLNQGHRIPGVVNTDSHYNHHGSSWLRNWLACSTDDPAKVSTDEMVRQAEAGHVVSATGPFLSVSATSNSSPNAAIPGDDLVAADGKAMLQVRVQCPNWLDVNRVQVFVNGRRNGNRPPIAVSNPIFIDVDANGFQHNGDELGLPLPQAAH